MSEALLDSRQVSILMAQAGPLLGTVEVRENADGAGWTITGENGTIVFVDLPHGAERLWLSAEVGMPRPEDRTRLHALMLAYNGQWRETGGTRLWTEEPEGLVLQGFDIPAGQGLTPQRLAETFHAFTGVLEGWRSILAAPSAALEGGGLLPPHVLRG